MRAPNKYTRGAAHLLLLFRVCCSAPRVVVVDRSALCALRVAVCSPLAAIATQPIEGVPRGAKIARADRSITPAQIYLRI